MFVSIFVSTNDLLKKKEHQRGLSRKYIFIYSPSKIMNAHNGSVAETRIDEQIGFLFSALLRFLQKDFNGISN